ncbi:unnamed protein product [Sphacelaria rigidula]
MLVSQRISELCVILRRELRPLPSLLQPKPSLQLGALHDEYLDSQTFFASCSHILCCTPPLAPHQFLAANQGEYEICLSNDRRFEQGTKHVLLNVKEKTEDASSTKKEPTENTDKDKKENKGRSAMRSSYMKIINERLEDLREEFEKIKMHQIREKKSLTLRENEAEENHKSMVRSSVTETVVLLLVSAGQIFFVRRWFQGKGTLLKQWS